MRSPQKEHGKSGYRGEKGSLSFSVFLLRFLNLTLWTVVVLSIFTAITKYHRLDLMAYKMTEHIAEAPQARKFTMEAPADSGGGVSLNVCFLVHTCHLLTVSSCSARCKRALWGLFHKGHFIIPITRALPS